MAMMAIMAIFGCDGHYEALQQLGQYQVPEKLNFWVFL